jgi:hypothetical protein
METKLFTLKEVVTMKAFNMSNVDVHQFMQALDSCSGDVMLITDEGDKFNLKSNFSQYIAMGALLGNHGDDLELWCDDKEDEARFLNFFNKHPEV